MTDNLTELPKHWAECVHEIDRPAILETINALLASGKARKGAQCKVCNEAGMRNCSDFVRCGDAKDILIIELE